MSDDRLTVTFRVEGDTMYTLANLIEDLEGLREEMGGEAEVCATGQGYPKPVISAYEDEEGFVGLELNVVAPKGHTVEDEAPVSSQGEPEGMVPGLHIP